MNTLEEKLIQLQRFVGVKYLLSDMEMEMLMEYLTEEFADMAIEEIENAVRLAVAGRLVLPDGKNIEHYQELSASYLTKVCRPYQNYRGGIIRKYHDAEIAIIEADRLKHIKPETKEDKHKKMLNATLSAFHSFKNGIPTIALDMIYDFLLSEKKIHITESRWKQYTETAKQTIKLEATKGNTIAKTILEAIKLDESSNGSLLARVKTLAVKGYFTKIMESEPKEIEIPLSKCIIIE